MNTRVAVMAIIVEKDEAVEPLNKLLHEYGDFIIGDSLNSVVFPVNDLHDINFFLVGK